MMLTKNSNQKLIDYETHKLLQLIEKQDLYRKGCYLYDVEKNEPRYNIAEFAWTFCKEPMVAYKIETQLENMIEDIPDPCDMSIDEITLYLYPISDVYSRFQLYPQHTCERTIDLCRFMHVVTAQGVLNRFDKTSQENVCKLLQVLDQQHWTVANHFLSKIKV